VDATARILLRPARMTTPPDTTTGRRIDGPAGALFVDDGGPTDGSTNRSTDGAATPVLFVHSYGGDTRHWAPALDHLRATRRACALDFRGHGRSDPPRDGDYSIEATAEDVGTAADALGLGRFVLVGHSQGALVALAYAAVHPDRVVGLLLVDAPPDPASFPPEVHRQVDAYVAGLVPETIGRVSEDYLRTIAGPDDAVRERLLRDLRATPRATVREAGVKAIMAFDPKPALGRYHGPTRAIVTPQNDGPGSLHHLGDGFPHDVVTGTGHWLHLDRPDEFVRLLDAFLRSLDERAA